MEWLNFSEEEFSHVIINYNNSSAPGPDKMSVKIVDGGLYFYFYFFSIFRTTRVRVYQSRCHISHKLMAKSQD